MIGVWFWSLVHLLVPRRCAVCGENLQEGEEGICLRCNLGMPRTNYHLTADNPVERMFFGKVPLERATSWFFYASGSSYCNILYRLKYKGGKALAEQMGRMMARELLPSGFFRGIDVLVPIPLHPKKQRQRGYNQSECLVRGISAVTGIGVDTRSVVRQTYTDTQTRKSAFGRWENVKGIFLLRSPEAFAGKHVLLVDDVLTTGATTTACADVLSRVEGIRISVLTLAKTER